MGILELEASPVVGQQLHQKEKKIKRTKRIEEEKKKNRKPKILISAHAQTKLSGKAIAVDQSVKKNVVFHKSPGVNGLNSPNSKASIFRFGHSFLITWPVRLG